MSQETSVVIVGAARTPVGSFNGAFADVQAHQLGATAIREALSRAKVDAGEVDEVVMGQILSAGEARTRRRQAAMAAGIPQEATAWGLNQLCGSGLRAVAIGMQQIAMGDAKIIVAGGQESMSMAPHAAHLRSGQKMGDLKLVDTMLKDGLMDAFHGYHMGNTAENVSRQWQITREMQDEFAVRSQNKAEAAQVAGRFKDEIVPFTVKGRKGDTIVSDDEYIKAGTTLDKVQKLRPAFDKEGTVTAANASGINDGAAVAVLMSEAEASRRGLTPLVRIVSWATAGVDPAIMGTGPIPASRRALEKAGWSVEDLDLVEANEAFAAQACAVNKDLGWNPDIVNVNGGAIAIGHPIGASGARVMNTLIFEMMRPRRQEGPCPRSASAAAWASRCASNACDRGPNPGTLKRGGRKSSRSKKTILGRKQHEQSGGGHRRHARHRCGDFEGSEGGGLPGRGELCRQRRGGEGLRSENNIPVRKFDVANYEDCAANVKAIEDELGSIDVLVNMQASPRTRCSTR